MADQTYSSSVGRKKYPIRNRNIREIFYNLIQWDNVEFSYNENKDQSDVEIEPKYEKGEDSYDDTHNKVTFL